MILGHDMEFTVDCQVETTGSSALMSVLRHFGLVDSADEPDNLVRLAYMYDEPLLVIEHPHLVQ